MVTCHHDRTELNCSRGLYTSKTTCESLCITGIAETSVNYKVGLSSLPAEGKGILVLTDTSVLIICKFIAAAAFTPVASHQVDTHRIRATAVEASGTFIDI